MTEEERLLIVKLRAKVMELPTTNAGTNVSLAQVLNLLIPPPVVVPSTGCHLVVNGKVLRADDVRHDRGTDFTYPAWTVTAYDRPREAR